MDNKRKEVGLYNICDNGAVVEVKPKTKVYKCDPNLNKFCSKEKCAYLKRGRCECTQYSKYAAIPRVEKNGF